MVAIVISFLLLISMSAAAFAANLAEVYAETVTATTDKTVLIPVKIKNNSGIMGFKITVNYDETVLTSPKVTRGSITENGNFNDSIGVTSKGTFDVVWNGAENSTGNGTVMILSFMPLKSEETQITLDYSRPDTFNESWEDVELKCSDITVKFSAKISDDEKEKEDSVSINQAETPPSSEEIKNAVDIAIGETDKENIDNITEEEKSDFIERTNEILNQLTGGTKKPFESVDEIKDAYDDAVADEFIDNTKGAVDSDKIESAIKDSLESVSAESIDKIPDDKKTDFIQKVENNLLQYAPDVEKISDKLTVDEAVEAIGQLQSENAEEATHGEKVPVTMNDEKGYPIFLIIALAIAVAAITTIIVVYIKRKSKNKEVK